MLIFQKRCDSLWLKAGRLWAPSPKCPCKQGEGEGEGKWEEEEESRGVRTISFQLFSFWWERVRKLLNITGGAELNGPKTEFV